MIAAAGLLLVSCTYMKYAGVQAEYKRLQAVDPSQRNLKHMIERPNFAVVGQTVDVHGIYASDPHTKAIVAFSSRFQADEVVDVMHDVGVGTNFGLNLPAGNYRIVAMCDGNDDGVYESDEVIGESRLSLSVDDCPAMVLTHHVVRLREPSSVSWATKIAVVQNGVARQSFVYPAGTIRDLSEPIFAKDVATLGLYDPASFLEQVPTMFHALEEDIGWKIPVVFVHGIGGHVGEFDPLVRQLDRQRFKPWFYYYPSGGDLDQMAELFYAIFLSGDPIPRSELVPMVIVAHSMGGLVVRKALELFRADGGEHPAITFVSLASPFGGHPSARLTRGSTMLVLPSWRSLDPEGEFVQQLFRHPLPGCVTHHLLYAYGNDSLVKFGENNDGVVPLSSQLHPPAQQQSHTQLGLNVSHVGVRDDPEAVAAILRIVADVKTAVPDDHMRSLRAGGFDVGDDARFSARERWDLRMYGRYMLHLARGDIEPINSFQEQLVAMVRGEVEPSLDEAKVWLRFLDTEQGRRLRR